MLAIYASGKASNAVVGYFLAKIMTTSVAWSGECSTVVGFVYLFVCFVVVLS